MRLYRVTYRRTLVYLDVEARDEQDALRKVSVEFDCEYDELTVELLP